MALEMLNLWGVQCNVSLFSCVKELAILLVFGSHRNSAKLGVCIPGKEMTWSLVHSAVALSLDFFAQVKVDPRLTQVKR